MALWSVRPQPGAGGAATGLLQALACLGPAACQAPAGPPAPGLRPLPVLDQVPVGADVANLRAKAASDKLNYERYELLVRQGAASPIQRDQVRQEYIASKEALIAPEADRRMEANQRMEAGLSALEAARDSARSRLRPILMTAIASLLGFLPLVCASGAGARSQISLGTVVIDGLAVATVLSLCVVPVFHVVIKTWLQRQAADTELVELPASGTESG